MTFKRLYKQIFFSTIVIILFPFAQALQTDPNLQKIADDYLSTYATQTGVTGFSIAASCPNSHYKNIVYAGLMGLKNFHPVDENSVFQIGSITKSFISVILLQYEAEGVQGFSINDTVGKWFPEYPSWAAVTIKQLMNMTAGIPDYTQDNEMLQKYFSQSNKYLMTKKDIVDWVYKNKLNSQGLPILFSPGTSWFYSNTQYTILGMLVEKLSRAIPIEEIVKNKIIDKLNLDHTYFPHNLPEQVIKETNIMSGYQNESEFIIPAGTDVSRMSTWFENTHGGMESTSNDILKYVKALFHEKKDGGLLPQKQLDELTSLVDYTTGQPTTINGYGLGIRGDDDFGDGTIAYNYTGETFGFAFNYIYSPSKDMYLVFPVNSRSLILDGSYKVPGSITYMDLNIYNYLLTKCQIQNK